MEGKLARFLAKRQQQLNSTSSGALKLLAFPYGPTAGREKGEIVNEVARKEAEDLKKSSGILDQFAANTGLEPPSPSPRRYLWTDAFAVCQFLDRGLKLDDARSFGQAEALITQVHETLGRHRVDDHKGRTGWISGLSEEDGSLHPTVGGLRIGKPMAERSKELRINDDSEWDRDGQYFHYLTKWMMALSTAYQVLRQPRYLIWALELAKGIHNKFVVGRRMYWKMSIDLSYPQVTSMGHHDPLDGYLTYSQLEQLRLSAEIESPSLASEIAELERICDSKDWSTSDSLGLGGLMTDVTRAVHLYLRSKNSKYFSLALNLLEATSLSLDQFSAREKLSGPAEYRLAFREFGLSIGLQSLALLRVELSNVDLRSFTLPSKVVERFSTLLDNVLRNFSMVASIHAFWGATKNQNSRTWVGHKDINMIMLATSLCPHTFLGEHSQLSAAS